MKPQLLSLFTLLPTTALGVGDGDGPKPLISSERMRADITSENLMNNLRALDRIASAHGGNRAFGLPGYQASVDYIWDRVSELPGTRAWKQEFSSLFDMVVSIDLRVDNAPIPVYGLTFSPSTSKEGLTAEIVSGVDGDAGCLDASYSDWVKGKIVWVKRGRCPTGGTLAGRLLPAARAGAAAVIIYNDSPTNISGGGTLSTPDKDHVPGGFINQVDGLRVRARLDAGEKVQGYFQHTQIVEQRATENVFVEIEKGDPDNIIMLGAHLDSVQAGAGINDDGSGTSLILELLLAAVEYETKNRIRFAWWGAEENGLLGSRHYCSSLNASEVNSILAYLNFDMVSRGFIGVGDGDGSSYGRVAPPGSGAIEKLFTDYFLSQDIVVTPANLTNGSDYTSFWRILNKPFGYLHTGTGAAQDPCYHRACDTIQNPNPETIKTNALAAAHVLSVLAVNGTAIIPKAKVNATSFAKMRVLDAGPHFVDLDRLDMWDDHHVGCNHEF